MDSDVTLPTVLFFCVFFFSFSLENVIFSQESSCCYVMNIVLLLHELSNNFKILNLISVYKYT